MKLTTKRVTASRGQIREAYARQEQVENTNAGTRS